MNSIFKLYLISIPISGISVALNEYSKRPNTFHYDYSEIGYKHLTYSFNEGLAMAMITACSPVIVPVSICHYFYNKINNRS